MTLAFDNLSTGSRVAGAMGLIELLKPSKMAAAAAPVAAAPHRLKTASR